MVNILFFDGFSGAPSEVNSTLSFCPYKGKTCCNSMEDSSLMKQFQAMNISDKGCASVVKSILCAVSTICLLSLKILQMFSLCHTHTVIHNLLRAVTIFT